MTADELNATAMQMVAPGKGILAMDESTPTCTKRFEKLGIESTEDTRRTYRDLLVTTPDLSEFISGAILYDETIRQQISDGTSFPHYMAERGILPGIKVDTGAKDLAAFPGEKITEGLDRLRERLAEYKDMGARFTKWRAVITIGEGLPTRACVEANTHALARYAALAQEAGLLPIVEPEVLINGSHTIDRCYEVTVETLHNVFDQLHRQHILYEGMILKASMVISGTECPRQASVEEVAGQTVRCLLQTVPAAVAGIAFLSGGQTNEQATAHLNAMNATYTRLPWPLTFSYARALQQPPMEAWRGDNQKIPEAQKALLRRARLNGAAARGEYRTEMEKAA